MSEARPCPRCQGASRFVRLRYFDDEVDEVWECARPTCYNYALYWHHKRDYTKEEEHAVRLRVLHAESALAKAKEALVSAEVELKVARSFAENVFNA